MFQFGCIETTSDSQLAFHCIELVAKTAKKKTELTAPIARHPILEVCNRRNPKIRA